jgi:hypothetical protein
VRPVALALSIVAVVAATTFAVVRIATSGGGGYSDLFLALGLIPFLLAVGGVAALISAARRGGGTVTATASFLDAAATLVIVGLAAGFR